MFKCAKPLIYTSKEVVEHIIYNIFYSVDIEDLIRPLYILFNELKSVHVFINGLNFLYFIGHNSQ